MTNKDASTEIAKESQRQLPEDRNDLQGDKEHQTQSLGHTLRMASDGFGAVLNGIAAKVQQLCDEYRPQIEVFSNNVTKLAQLIVEHKPQIEAIFRASELIEAHPKIGKLTENLRRDGWFLPYSHALASDVVLQNILRIADLPVSQQLQSIQQWYLEHFYAFADVICDKYPSREPIIRQAVEAYRNGQHYLTAPIFFSQADGICVELIGCELFRGGDVYKHAKGQTLITLDPLDILLGLIWAPLGEKPEVALNETERGNKGYYGFNRHTVMHGECTDYGTQENSLKAFSLLLLIARLPESPKKPADNELSSPGGTG